MPNTTQDALYAAEIFGAIEIEADRYAWQHNKTWYVGNGKTVIAMVAGTPFWQAHARRPVAMPSWWTPDNRFAWRVLDGEHEHDAQRAAARYASKAEAMRDVGYDPTCDLPTYGFERITVDLEISEEIPA